MDKVTIEDLAKVAGLTGEGGRRFVDAIVAALLEGKSVMLRRLGVLRLSAIEARPMGRPMLPPGEHQMPRRQILRFRSAPSFKELLRKEGL